MTSFHVGFSYSARECVLPPDISKACAIFCARFIMFMAEYAAYTRVHSILWDGSDEAISALLTGLDPV